MLRDVRIEFPRARSRANRTGKFGPSRVPEPIGERHPPLTLVPGREREEREREREREREGERGRAGGGGEGEMRESGWLVVNDLCRRGGLRASVVLGNMNKRKYTPCPSGTLP